MSRIVDVLPSAALTLVEANEESWSESELRRKLQDVTAPMGLVIDLAFEKDPVTGRSVPDLLIIQPGLGTFLLCYGPDDGKPWVVRGAQRNESSQLLTVGDEQVDIEEAVIALEMLWDDPVISQRVIWNALIKRELRRSPPPIGPHDIEEYVRRFRRAKRLYKASDFKDWLKARALTAEQFYERISEEVRAFVLKRRQIGKAPEYFEEHRQDFDRISLARWSFGSPEEAEATRERIQQVGDFWSWFAAHPPEIIRGFASTIPEPVRPWARSGGVWVGPVPADKPRGANRPPQSFHLYRVLTFEEATFDAATQTAVEERLWEQWLEQLRAEVPVRWHWGRAQGRKDSTGNEEVRS